MEVDGRPGGCREGRPGQGQLWGSCGIGSPGHLGGGLLENLTGTQMQHMPYREVSQLYTSVAASDVAWSLGTLPSSQEPYKAGKLRYLAIAVPKRIAQLPNVPTVAEAGGPAAFEVNSFVVLVAPKGLPPTLRANTGADVTRNAEAKPKTYEQLIRRANISLE